MNSVFRSAAPCAGPMTAALARYSRLTPRFYGYQGGAMRLLLALAALGAVHPAAAQARDATSPPSTAPRSCSPSFRRRRPAAGPEAPTVLEGPAGAGSRDTNQDGASDESTGNVGIGPLRKAGFNVLDLGPARVRQLGRHRRGRLAGRRGPRRSALIDWLAHQPEVQLDDAEPRPAHGHGRRLLRRRHPARDRRASTAGSTRSRRSSPGTRCSQSLYKEETFKSGWSSAALRARRSARTAAWTRTSLRRSPRAYPTGTLTPATKAWFAARGPGDLVERDHACRPCSIEGTADTLFTLQEAIENYAILLGERRAHEDDVVLRRARRVPDRRRADRAHRGRGRRLAAAVRGRQTPRWTQARVRVAGRRRVWRSADDYPRARRRAGRGDRLRHAGR